MLVRAQRVLVVVGRRTLALLDDILVDRGYQHHFKLSGIRVAPGDRGSGIVGDGRGRVAHVDCGSVHACAIVRKTRTI